MKYVEIGFVLTNDLGIKETVIQYNDTHLPSDSYLIKRVAITILRSLELNKNDVALQDILNELEIK